MVLETAGRVTGAVMKLRVRDGAATFCLEALRAVLAKVLEAILDTNGILVNTRMRGSVCSSESKKRT